MAAAFLDRADENLVNVAVLPVADASEGPFHAGMRTHQGMARH